MKRNLSRRRTGYKSVLHFYCLLFILFSTLLLNSVNAQVHLVKDINTYDDPNSAEFRNLTDFNGDLYFTSKEKELWKSTTPDSGFVKIKNFKAIYEFFKTSSALFFLADDSVSGKELWKTNGTEAGTVLVKDIIPGIAGSSPYSFTDVNGILYFVVHNGKNGKEVWKSDGTTSGTGLVKDIVRGKSSSNPTNLVSFNNKLFFVANDGHNGFEVWESDGTLAGTNIFTEIMPGSPSSSPNHLTVVGNTLYFIARDANGLELWKTDGTVAGAVFVKDVRPGSYSSFPENLLAVGNTLYFRANDGFHGFELWKSDGTEAGTSLVIDHVRGKQTGFSWINGMIAVNNILYYIKGDEVYKTNGTTEGTELVLTLRDYYSAKEMAVIGNSLYIVDNDYYQPKLVRIDDAANTTFWTISDNVDVASYAYLTRVDNKLYFVGNNNSQHLTKLYKSDGTTDGTFEALDLYNITQGGNPYNLTAINGEVYFNSLGPDYFLWKSDGTEAGTQRICNCPGSYMTSSGGTVFFNSYGSLMRTNGTTASTYGVAPVYYPQNLTDVNGTLFFKGLQYQYGSELWKSDGTASGTVMVKDIYSGVVGGHPDNLTYVNGNLFFTASDGQKGRELWKSDGTTAGTVLVKDITPGLGASGFGDFIGFKSQLFFTAWSLVNGYELWKSDGTEGGTILVHNVSARDLKVVGDVLYFVGVTGHTEIALWKSDGTTAGTVRVKVFNTVVEILNNLDNELMFLVGNENFSQRTLWKTNGTESGTVSVKSLGYTSNENTAKSVRDDGVLYINLLNKVNSFDPLTMKLWRTDGTECGTYKIDYNGTPSELTLAGDKLLFAGDFDQVGRELLRLEPSEIAPPPCESSARLEDSSLINDINVNRETPDSLKVSYYPNPFSDKLLLRVNGETDIKYNVSVINMKGVAIDNYQNLKSNVDYEIGTVWNSGIYLLKINMHGKTFTRKVMKH